MTPSFVLVLVITGGVISGTGLLASWVIRFANIKFFLNSSTVISDAPQTEMIILAGTLTVAEGLTKVQTNTNLPETASVKTMSRVTSGSSVLPKASSAVAIVDLSWKTTAEAATVIAAGSQETTTEGRVTSSETLEKVRTATNTAQTMPIKPERSLTKISPTRKSEVDTIRFIKTTEVSSTIAKKDSQTRKAETIVTCFTQTETEITADISSASLIPEPITDETKSVTNIITSESKETTKAGTEDTFRMLITTTGTNTEPADLPDITTGKMVPGTVEKPREPTNVETSKTTTVRPKRSSQATKTSSTMRRTTSVKYTTTIATTTGTTEKTDKKQFTAADTSLTKTNILITAIKSRFTSRSFPHISTAGLNTISPVRPSVNVFNKLTTQSYKPLSPCKGKCKTTSTAKNPAGRRDDGKVPLTYDKTLYSAITMGCILVLCTILAFIVFIKDFVW
ncbi:mucin-16-like [Triplophysa rosa]|uniref:mucin-16-like n=1 Tax=Triplophysa rosa TaxID=992332 RepID=UPI002545BF37|nr:mucin-16-like [Triplophysa rosa]